MVLYVLWRVTSPSHAIEDTNVAPWIIPQVDQRVPTCSERQMASSEKYGGFIMIGHALLIPVIHSRKIPMAYWALLGGKGAINGHQIQHVEGNRKDGKRWNLISPRSNGFIIKFPICFLNWGPLPHFETTAHWFLLVQSPL